MSFRVFCLAVLALAVLPACAATPESAPSRPALNDPFLDHLTGDWDLTRTIRGKTVHNSVTAKWVLAHQFVQIDMIETARPATYEARVLIGFDAERSRYVAHWCDSFGGGYSSIGYGVRRDNSIEFRFDYPDGPFFNTFTWAPGAGTWACRLENGKPDGTRAPFAQDVLARP